MICRNCLRVASRAQSPFSKSTWIPSRPSQRFLTTTASLLSDAQPATTSAPSASPRIPPARTTSSSSAQPFSAPLTPGADPGLTTQAAEQAKKKVAPLVKSSIPAGQPLKGLNFLKNAQDPVALPDEEYPEWLWTVLDRQEKKDEVGAGDLFSKSKKQRRLAAKRLRKEQAMNPGMLEPKIPIYEQTIDLPSGDGSLAGAIAAADARGELTKALRTKRRASIKETNFLKAMA